MTAPELKPCPFCGGKAVTEILIVEGVVFCSGCRATIIRKHEVKEDNGQDNAIDAWNRRADLAAVQLAQVRVKPLVWDDGTNNRKYAKSEIGQYSAREFSIDNVRLDLNGKLLAGSFQTIEAAKAAAQADYEARILAALEPQPISKSADLHDPRDEVIARLVEAVELADAALAGANMNMKIVRRKVEAALAAAKAVQHD